MNAHQLFWGSCDECGSELRVRSGPNGRFLGCSAYPRCENTEELDAEARAIIKSRAERQ